jgi:hypothetical protein
MARRCLETVSVLWKRFPLGGNEYPVRQYSFIDFNAIHLGKVKIQVFHFFQDFTICLLM